MFAVRALNSAPSIRMLAPTGVLREVSPITFSAAIADIPADLAGLVVEWDFSYNGTTFVTESTGTSVAYAFPDNGTYIVAARVTDEDGAVSSIVTRTVTIANVAPTVELGSNQIVDEGSVISLVSTVANDVAGNADVLLYSWRVTDPANVVIAQGSLPNFSFTVFDNKVYTVSLTVNDVTVVRLPTPYSIAVAMCCRRASSLRLQLRSTRAKPSM